MVTFDDPRQAERIIHAARSLNTEVRVLVRTRDDTHLDLLTEAGAEEIVPEVLEASLMLVAHALMMLDVPFERVLAMLRKTRRERYKMLQGYYHGANFPTADSAGNPYRLLHAVTLEAKANAIGKCLSDCKLKHVEVRTLKRGDDTIDNPIHSLSLECGDTLVLYGTLDALEAAEAWLLAGR